MNDSLRAEALLADLPREGRGRLKVFLGAAPGVGKTYAMLQAAHAQLRQAWRCAPGWWKATAAARPRRCWWGCRNSRRCACPIAAWS